MVDHNRFFTVHETVLNKLTDLLNLKGFKFHIQKLCIFTRNTESGTIDRFQNITPYLYDGAKCRLTGTNARRYGLLKMENSFSLINEIL